MKTKAKTTKEERNNQQLKQLGFQKEHVRKVCFKEQANTREGKGKKKKTKETQKNAFQKKGWWTQKKNEILKGKTEGKQKKTE